MVGLLLRNFANDVLLGLTSVGGVLNETYSLLGGRKGALSPDNISSLSLGYGDAFLR